MTEIAWADVRHAAPKPTKELAFLAIITAAITSTVIERWASKRRRDEAAEEKRVESRFDTLDGRLDLIEQALSRLSRDAADA